MKLIVQIPCFNEEATLAATIAGIPRTVQGFERVEVLVVDDGSSDATAEVARRCGADHLVSHRRNRGLARAFRTGVDACLRAGADVIVNTDGDNQYAGSAIPQLVRPILERRADLVVGDRGPAHLARLPFGRRCLHRLGSLVVRRLSGLPVPDPVSGFRALSRETALRLNILSSFSYTIEMLIQAGQERLAVAVVPVPVNPRTRTSRLYRTVPEFLLHSLAAMVRTYTMYRPLRVFSLLGGLLLLIGVLPVARFLVFYLAGQGNGHLQSLVLGAASLVLGFMSLLIGVVADLIARNRTLVEGVLERVKRIELAAAAAGGSAPGDPGAPDEAQCGSSVDPA